MLQIITERSRKTVKDYYLEFYFKDDYNSGFSFPATKDGNPAFKKMTKEAIYNYNKCLTDDRLTEAKFTAHNYSYTEPAVGRCSCGAKVILESSYMGAVHCNKCNKWYNIFGQELREPKYWEDNYE